MRHAPPRWLGAALPLLAAAPGSSRWQPPHGPPPRPHSAHRPPTEVGLGAWRTPSGAPSAGVSQPRCQRTNPLQQQPDAALAMGAAITHLWRNDIDNAQSGPVARLDRRSQRRTTLQHLVVALGVAPLANARDLGSQGRGTRHRIALQPG